MSDHTFTRVVYPKYNRDGTLKRPGWTEQWRLVGSHTSTARVGEAPTTWPNCAGCCDSGSGPSGRSPAERRRQPHRPDYPLSPLIRRLLMDTQEDREARLSAWTEYDPGSFTEQQLAVNAHIRHAFFSGWEARHRLSTRSPVPGLVEDIARIIEPYANWDQKGFDDAKFQCDRATALKKAAAIAALTRPVVDESGEDMPKDMGDCASRTALSGEAQARAGLGPNGRVSTIAGER